MSNMQKTYEKWWLFKFLKDGRQIMKVQFIGPPSGVYGQVRLTLSDGEEINAPQGPMDYRPRKKNFVVYDKNPKGPNGTLGKQAGFSSPKRENSPFSSFQPKRPRTAQSKER